MNTNNYKISKYLDYQGLIHYHNKLLESLNNDFASNLVYDKIGKKIYLRSKSNELLATIDATDFIKDGMVSNVYIRNQQLIIEFNTDSGKETISINLSDIFNPDNYYDKFKIDSKLAKKQDTLISGENVKTINNQSILGSGNIEITLNVPEWALQPTKPTYTASEVGAVSQADFNTTINQLSRSIQTETLLRQEADNNLNSNKQNTLISGENIKTINNQSLLGAGNINIESGLQGTAIIACNITGVDSAGRATVDNENWYAQALAAYNAKKIPVIKGTFNYATFVVPVVVQEGSPYAQCYGSTAITYYYGGGHTQSNIIDFHANTSSSAMVYVYDVQEKLVSGQNIKTINGQSIVGAGNMEIPTGLSAAYEVVDAGLLYLDQTETYYEVPATVYTALKAVWDAGKVPVLTGSLNSHTTGFALIPTSEDGSTFYCFFHAYNTMQGGNRWHLSGTISSTGGQLYPEEEQKPITVDQSVQSGSQNPVSGNAVYESFEDIETILDAILGSQVLNNGMERMLHTQEVAATLSPEIVHVFAGTTDTLAITLTAPTDTLSHLFTMILTTGTTPAVTIQVSDSTAIIYPDDYAIEAGTTYEISVLYANGKYYLRYVNYQEA